MSHARQPTNPPESPSQGAQNLPTPIPDYIGQYKVELLLSTSVTSDIFLAIHPQKKQPVVIKMLQKVFVNNPEMKQQFFNEARIMGSTNHPGIIKLFDEGEWNDRVFIVTEFINGISLSHFVTRSALSLRRGVEILLEIGYALAHLHANNVIHHDLKPDNILITETGKVKILDFGISQLHHEETSAPNRGTPSYMAPELEAGNYKGTFASDIYSLAVIGYELIAGHLSLGYIQYDLLPSGVKTILKPYLDPNPETRKASVSMLVRELTEYLKGHQIERDRNHIDHLKETYETAIRSQKELLPTLLPHVEGIQISHAIDHKTESMGYYYNLYKLGQNRILFVFIQAEKSSIEGAISISRISGMIDLMIAQKQITSPSELATHLEKHSKHPFSLDALELNLETERLSFISCGVGKVYKEDGASHNIKSLSTENHPIGSDKNRILFQQESAFEKGDTLFFHTLNISQEKSALFAKSLSESRHISVDNRSDFIIKKWQPHIDIKAKAPSQLCFCIHKV